MANNTAIAAIAADFSASIDSHNLRNSHSAHCGRTDRRSRMSFERRLCRPLGMAEFMTVEELCELLAVSRSTFYKWRTRGLAPAALELPNGSLRFKRSDVDAWIGDRMEDAA